MLAKLGVDLLLSIAFGVITWLSFRTAKSPQRAAALASVFTSRLQGAPRVLRGNEWAHGPSALRWYSFMIGLASLNFLLIGFHLVPLVFLSVFCFFLTFPAVGFFGLRGRIRKNGIKALTRPRLWELLASGLIFFYAIGVLLLAKALLAPH